VFLEIENSLNQFKRSNVSKNRKGINSDRNLPKNSDINIFLIRHPVWETAGQQKINFIEFIFKLSTDSPNTQRMNKPEKTGLPS